MSEPPVQPDRPAQIERWPTPPPLNKDWYVITWAAGLLGLLGALFAVAGPFSHQPLAMQIAGGSLLALALACAVVAVRLYRASFATNAAAQQAHEASLRRIQPRWVRVVASEFGDPLHRYTEHGPSTLLGFEMRLTLALLPDPGHPPTDETVQLRHNFEPHLAGALVRGALLEVAYDPQGPRIVPQRLLHTNVQFTVRREPNV